LAISLSPAGASPVMPDSSLLVIAAEARTHSWRVRAAA
jgi:hypothetical protein